ncbi:MAG: TRAP transporter small permease [Hyphomicrobiaceae bacterium]
MLGLIAHGIGRLAEVAASLLRASLVATLVVMMSSIVFQVVMRYVLGNTLSWTEELAILMFAWGTLGGLALGVHEGFHVRLDLLIGYLSPPLLRGVETAIGLLTTVFGAYVAWSGERFFDFTRGSTSAAIGYPIEFLHGLAPIAGALICLFALNGMIQGPRSEPEPDLSL